MRNKQRKPNKPTKGGKSSPQANSCKAPVSTNDPSWYASDPAILRDAASIPFSWALGTPINVTNEQILPYDWNNRAIPGIMRFDVEPTMGLSVTADSALNTASVSMYSYVRHANSGHANYDAPDLMLYCGAMSQVYAFINWCQRLYGCAMMYAQKNRYFPRHLLSSMDVDADSICNNLANFRYWINVMVAKASSLAVPANMSYFNRSSFMYSYIYCESEQIKDQLYYYHPASWLKFEFNSGTKAGHLKRVKLTPTSGMLTLPEIQRFGEEMLGSVLQDEDMNIMSGDILKAYGIDGIIKLAAIPEILDVFPIYDEYVLEQMHNASVYPAAMSDIDQDPDNGYLTSINTVKEADLNGVSMLFMNKVLSVNKVEPMPEDVIESSRLMLSSDSSRYSGGLYYVGCGTEIISNCHIYTLTDAGALSKATFNTVTAESVPIASVLKSFKFAPTVYFKNNESGHLTTCAQSVDNYAVLSPQDVYKLHDVALMNMFAVPSVAKVTRV